MVSLAGRCSHLPTLHFPLLTLILGHLFSAISGCAAVCHCFFFLSPKPRIITSYFDMNILHEFDTDVFGLVRSYEGTRFVENLALESVTKDADYFELSKGEYVRMIVSE